MQSQNSKFKIKNRLKDAVDFHGHLGPYLVLGMLLGELAIKKLKAKRHFGLEAIIKGADKKPKSCLIDGIQFSAGCTYGKGNIRKLGGSKIEALFKNLNNGKKISIFLKEGLTRDLDCLDGHRDSERFAKKLLSVDPMGLFNVKF